jgi:hypothetical protein
MDNFSELIRAAVRADITDSVGDTALSSDFERRVMLEVACHAIARSRRRARFSLIVSLTCVGLTAAACITMLVLWLPTNIILEVDLYAAFTNILASFKALLP